MSEIETINSADIFAKYIIKVYSPYLSFLIEEAFDIKSPSKRAVRLRELIYQTLVNSTLYEDEIKDIENKLDNSNYPNFKIKKDKNQTGDYWVNTRFPYVTGTVFYLVSGDGHRNENGEIIISYDKFTIKRLEYGTNERGTKDFYVKNHFHPKVFPLW